MICTPEHGSVDTTSQFLITITILRPLNSPEVAIQSKTAAEASTVQSTMRESSPEIFPKADRSCRGTDTNHHKEPDADTRVEPLVPTPAS